MSRHPVLPSRPFNSVAPCCPSSHMHSLCCPPWCLQPPRCHTSWRVTPRRRCIIPRRGGFLPCVIHYHPVVASTSSLFISATTHHPPPPPFHCVTLRCHPPCCSLHHLLPGRHRCYPTVARCAMAHRADSVRQDTQSVRDCECKTDT